MKKIVQIVKKLGPHIAFTFICNFEQFPSAFLNFIHNSKFLKLLQSGPGCWFAELELFTNIRIRGHYAFLI